MAGDLIRSRRREQEEASESWFWMTCRGWGWQVMGWEVNSRCSAPLKRSVFIERHALDAAGMADS